MRLASAATAPELDVDARRRELFQSALVRPGLSGLSTGGRAKALPLGLRPVDAALPEGGLPRGVVVELSAPQGLARATTLALALCASAQADARHRGENDTQGAWCAWLDPTATLFAPGALRAGVDLERLLVIRPGSDDLARVAVRVAQSHAFSVVVIDTAGVPGSRGETRLDRWVTIVRRLALAVEGSDTTVLLLTDANASRAMPLPAAMRIELERLAEDKLGLRVAKDRAGRVTGSCAIDFGRQAARV
jgi:recombination protein RecA